MLGESPGRASTTLARDSNIGSAGPAGVIRKMHTQVSVRKMTSLIRSESTSDYDSENRNMEYSQAIKALSNGAYRFGKLHKIASAVTLILSLYT